MSRHLLTIEQFSSEEIRFPGYIVSSTAPINVEDEAAITVEKDPDKVLEEIADYLKQHEGNAEILIAIHGYNSDKSGARWWYEETRKYIGRNFDSQVASGFIVIGYRWPSEKVLPNTGSFFKKVQKVTSFLGGAFKALPKPLAIAGIFGFSIWLIGAILNTVIAIFNLVNNLTILVASSVALTISLLIVVVILTIFVLRVCGYFRDTYRAANYGVADLVEFIRQLDKKIVSQSPSEDIKQNYEFWEKEENNDRRIRLNFIGHSMGAYVVTNTVRILSDVFDRNSIGNLAIDHQKKCPSSNIGNVFRLGRLVLVAPDISAETIISGRGNSLRSSLRRFDEAYLFSNEGDMVLKLASTAANYFSFPAKTRDGGYRLGNVLVKYPANADTEKMGIVNLDEHGNLVLRKGKEFLDCLFLRQGTPLSTRQEQVGLENDRFIAELFTFFDCTDYKENGKGIVSKALGKSFLTYKDYVDLTFSGIDGHGGFLYHSDAHFCRRVIYGLSSLGLEKFLTTIDSTQGENASYEPEQRQLLLKLFSQECEAKGIQVLLANERYTHNIMGQERDRQGY
jgi:pimeloyl-ACP methyl ester carboxylesterase